MELRVSKFPGYLLPEHRHSGNFYKKIAPTLLLIGQKDFPIRNMEPKCFIRALRPKESIKHPPIVLEKCDRIIIKNEVYFKLFK